MMPTRCLLSRRAVLRGLGASVALPFLEAMTPSSVWASPAAKRPLRLAFLYAPNGKHMQAWTPAEVGAEFSLPPTLAPLEPFRDRLLVLTGLTCDKARANGDGAGDHARAMAAFLTGCQPRKTHGADLQAGVSVDQIAAERIGNATRLPSLEIGIERGQQAGNCDSGYSCAYSSNLSWRGPATPNPKEVNPKAVFERLFGSPEADEAKEGRGIRQQLRKSILDMVQEDARSLQRQLGGKDRQKLDEYLTSVRAVERRIENASQGEGAPEGAEKPNGIPKEYADHLRLMADLFVLAFQTDTTRVATYAFANEGSNRGYRHIGVSEGHHDLSHHGNDQQKWAKIQRINQFHVEQLAYLVGKLRETPEGDGTLLDQVMLVYGSGIGDGNRHNHDDLPILLIGGGGGTLQSGRHVRYAKETPLCNLYLSLLDRMGAPITRFGDSTGRLGQLT